MHSMLIGDMTNTDSILKSRDITLLTNVCLAKAMVFPVVMSLSDEICRVDLGVWKARGLPSDALFEAFVESAKPREGGRELLAELLGQIEDLIAEVEVGFSALEWRDFLEKYIELGMPAVHHSEQYREEYKPSYRVLERELAERLLK